MPDLGNPLLHLCSSPSLRAMHPAALHLLCGLCAHLYGRDQGDLLSRVGVIDADIPRAVAGADVVTTPGSCESAGFRQSPTWAATWHLRIPVLPISDQCTFQVDYCQFSGLRQIPAGVAPQ